MNPNVVKKIRSDRVPGTEITIIELDGEAFALDVRKLAELNARTAERLNGIHVNRMVSERQ